MIQLLLALFALQQPPATATSAAIVREVRQFKGVIGVSAKNLLTGEEINIEADRRFPTASSIKTAIMLEVYHQVADGRLRMDAPATLGDTDKVGGSGVLNGLHDGLTLTIRDLVSFALDNHARYGEAVAGGRLRTATTRATLLRVAGASASVPGRRRIR